jgi:hypothetical protein
VKACRTEARLLHPLSLQTSRGVVVVECDGRQGQGDPGERTRAQHRREHVEPDDDRSRERERGGAPIEPRTFIA